MSKVLKATAALSGTPTSYPKRKTQRRIISTAIGTGVRHGPAGSAVAVAIEWRPNKLRKFPRLYA